LLFHFTDPASTQTYTLSLHDALPICQSSGLLHLSLPAAHRQAGHRRRFPPVADRPAPRPDPCRHATPLAQQGSGRTVFLRVEYRSEEHTSELQSRENLVCRLLLEKKK